MNLLTVRKNEMLQWIQNIDNNFLEFIQTYLHSPVLDKTMPFISMLGNVGAVWIAIAVAFLLISRYRKYGIIMIGALLVSALLGEVVLKQLVERVRPCNQNTLVPMLIARPRDFSFPSGHTSSSFAAASVIWKANRKFGMMAYLLALLIAFSRLYLYVHYPSDILAGMVLGLTCGALSIAAAQWIYRKRVLQG
jgi:undecaprenyl-diphosphatase